MANAFKSGFLGGLGAVTAIVVVIMAGAFVHGLREGWRVTNEADAGVYGLSLQTSTNEKLAKFCGYAYGQAKREVPALAEATLDDVRPVVFDGQDPARIQCAVGGGRGYVTAEVNCDGAACVRPVHVVVDTKILLER